MHRLKVVAAACMMLIGCAGNADSQFGQTLPPQTTLTDPSADARFSAYWHAGKGEITRYALEQARYGEIRHGDAVMIFVTEDFDVDRQVKLEGERSGKNVVNILKLNLVKKFQTGIYPYSMMSSVFTPIAVDRMPLTLKITTSVQEWCGHVFMQLNRRGAGYHVRSYSYFEREGDQEGTLPGVMPEDEIWTRIRLAPGTLPTGDVKVIPATMTSRLRHTPLEAVRATGSLTPIGRDSTYGPLTRYTLAFESGDRVLAIDFQQQFPYGIIGWTESYRDGFGPQAKTLTTRARRTHQLMTDYWRHNASIDDSLRRELGLP